MVGRWREGWPDYALGHDARRTFQPRGGVRQVLLAIGAVKLLHVLGVWVHNQQMSGHGIFLSNWMLSDDGHIGRVAALLRYGILTASGQESTTRDSRHAPTVVREALTDGSGPRFRSSTR